MRTDLTHILQDIAPKTSTGPDIPAIRRRATRLRALLMGEIAIAVLVAIGVAGWALTSEHKIGGAPPAGRTQHATPLRPSARIQLHGTNFSSFVAAGAGAVWVVDGRNGYLFKVDPRKDRQVAAARVLDRDGLWSLTTIGDHVWIEIPRLKQIVMVDATTTRVIGHIHGQSFVSDLYPAAGSIWYGARGSRDKGGPAQGGHGIVPPVQRQRAVLIQRSQQGALVTAYQLPGDNNTRLDALAPCGRDVCAVIETVHHVGGVGGHATWALSASLWRIDPHAHQLLNVQHIGQTKVEGAVNPIVGSMTPGPNGSVWLTEGDSRRLVLLNRAGRIVTKVDLSMMHDPWPTVAAGGYLWVNDINTTLVARIDPSTLQTRLFRLPTNDNYLAGGFGSIWQVHPNGHLVRFDSRQ